MVDLSHNKTLALTWPAHAPPQSPFAVPHSLDLWGWLSDYGKYSASSKSNCLSWEPSAFTLDHFIDLSKVCLVFKHPSLDN